MTSKAFERIKAGLEEAVEIARGNKEPAKLTIFETRPTLLKYKSSGERFNDIGRKED